MGLCHSVPRQALCSRRTKEDLNKPTLRTTLPPGLKAVNADAVDDNPASRLSASTNVSAQQEDTSHYFQDVRLKSYAFLGESGCLSFSGCVDVVNGAPRPIIFTVVTRNDISDEEICHLQRIVGQTAGDKLLPRLAFFSERLISAAPGQQQQRTSSSKQLQSALDCISHNYASPEAITGSPVRNLQWSSCPSIQAYHSVLPKDVSICISGPCVSTSFSQKPISRLASCNPDIAAILSTITLADGQRLVACIDEVTGVQGNLLQELQYLQTRSFPGLTRILLAYALQIAQAVGDLHRLGLHHGSLTPAAVMLVAGGEDREKTHTSVPPAPPTGVTARPPLPPLPLVRPMLQCKLALYGLMNPAEHASRLHSNAAGWGAVSYLAPESLAAEATSLTHEALAHMDAHAFGALCYHMFTGTAPYHQYHAAQVLVGLSAGGLQLQWPPPDARRLPVPEPVRQLVARCLDRSPEARPDFAEIVAFLRSLQEPPSL